VTFRLPLALMMLVLFVPALSSAGEERIIEVVEVSGPIDERMVGFVVDAIESAGRQSTEVLVLQIDSPGVVSDETSFNRLIEAVSNPPLPVVAWVGPAPAVAYGGALQLLWAAPITAAAPDTRIGYSSPIVAGEDVIPGDPLAETTIGVTMNDPAGIDVMAAAPRQLIQALDGVDVRVGGIERTLSTVTPITLDDGTAGVTNLPTVFREPGLWTRFLRLGASPTAAFFLVAAALTVAVFEYFAAGPGIAAGVAALALVPGGYGLAVLPVRWWAAGLVGVAVLILAVSYQKGQIVALGALGIIGLLIGGFLFTDAAPQMTPAPAGVLLTVLGVGFFFFLAMPTVARSRFSIQVLERSDMVGRRGTATTDLGPFGEVEVDGARWMAKGRRGISAGDDVVVSGVDGHHLEVASALPDSE